MIAAPFFYLDCFWGYWVIRKVTWLANSHIHGIVTGCEMLPQNWMIIPILDDHTDMKMK